MHTTSLSHAESRSISIDASPQTVFSFVADPYNLPRWAPDFAQSVEPEGDRWIIDSGSGDLTIAVVTSPDHGTVDMLAGPQLDRGAFSRVLPNVPGSEYLFTLFFPPGTEPDAIAAQMGIVEQELQRVRELVEALQA